ncbi:DUF3006 family protein [Natranaerovirga pectinivora]|uniref:DUF3006 family protein n=1 Tax=Natranaerovirga pectinivora TaxID=682400 RepID=A0A4V2UZJ9_9FIRM|nr:DUF3006 domain-containing protein [Natranaerovirga pectinivora]TCT11628.1 DUF3006 family protein [Natranaerovirga pectinivora]
MKVIIDRFEGRFAVVELENKEKVNMPVELIPSEAKEGDIIHIYIDKKETEKRRLEMSSLMDKLWKK